MAFAANTDVSIDKSQGEIRNLLRKSGATGFAIFEEAARGAVAFELDNRRFVMRVPLPGRNDHQFTHRNQGAVGVRERTAASAEKVWEQACRQRWRALLLVIKAKMESVESGIETLEEAFLAHVMMPNGETVGEHVRPTIALTYAGKTMQPLLPGPEK